MSHGRQADIEASKIPGVGMIGGTVCVYHPTWIFLSSYGPFTFIAFQEVLATALLF